MNFAIVQYLNFPHNTLSHIAKAAGELENEQAIEVMINDTTRIPSIKKHLELSYPSILFNVSSLSREGRRYLTISRDGRTDPKNYEKPRQKVSEKVRMAPSGWLVDPFDIKEEDISIKDIAHHLSRICRFNGGSTGFYSVAEHSVKVANAVPDEFKLWALLHDAAEAYLGDITRPVRHRYDHFFKKDEDAILAVIAVKFGLDQTIPEVVKEADDFACKQELYQIEKGQLYGNNPETAERFFMYAFKHLTRDS